MRVARQVQDLKFRLEDNSSSLFRSPEHICYRNIAQISQISTWSYYKCSPLLTSDVELEDCGTIQTCILSSVPVSLEFCDTHQHPAISSFISRTTAKRHKPTCFLIRTHTLKELLMLKGEWGCFHIIWKNKKNVFLPNKQQYNWHE